MTFSCKYKKLVLRSSLFGKLFFPVFIKNYSSFETFFWTSVKKFSVSCKKYLLRAQQIIYFQVDIIIFGLGSVSGPGDWFFQMGMTIFSFGKLIFYQKYQKNLDNFSFGGRGERVG